MSLWTWCLQRLGLRSSRQTGPGPALGATASAPAARPAGRSEGAPASAPATTATSGGAQPLVPGPRKPLLNRQGQLAGFEHPGPAPGALAEAERAAALLREMEATLQGGRSALATLPLSSLLLDGLMERVRPGMMLALSDAPFAAPDHAAALALLRQRGARLGAVGVPREGAAFVLLDGAPSERAALLQRIEACRRTAPRCEVVVTGIRTVDDLEAALAGGCTLASGLIDRSVTRQETGTMGPEMQRLCRLLNRAMSDDDTRALADEIRPDVALSYRLLRGANSPLLGLARTVETVDQALQLIGRQSLVRLLTTLLLVSSATRPSALALQEIALARARLLERLADAVGGPPEALFTVGQLSLLDVMLKLPMADALAPLSLPTAAREALLEARGPWYSLIELARHVEAGQDEAVERLSATLGGVERVRQAVAESWAWAAQTCATMHANRSP